MARLPQPGSDQGVWGDVLNDYLLQAHEPTGDLRSDSVSEAKLDTAVRTKLNATAAVTSVAGKSGVVSLVKADIGLANVDNTSDANKPISTATQTALSAKANTSELAAVATSGSYTDLTNTPVIPTITVSATAPSNPAAGDLWVDLSA